MKNTYMQTFHMKNTYMKRDLHVSRRTNLKRNLRTWKTHKERPIHMKITCMKRDLHRREKRPTYT